MSLEMTLGDEALVAAIEGADKGSLTRVDAQMGLQVTSFVELTQALDEGAEQWGFSSTLALSPLEATGELDALATKQIEKTLSWGQSSARCAVVSCFQNGQLL